MITLLTTTRNRPYCFSLLERFVKRQTYKSRYQWVVVGEDFTNYRFTMGQEVILRTEKATDNLPSICMNWLKAIPAIKGELVFVMEDDDWYSPCYLETLLPMLNQKRLVGIRGDLYYKLPIRKYKMCGNAFHSSLASTAFHADVLPLLKRMKLWKSVYIDAYLWAEFSQQSESWGLISNRGADGKALHVGMKQMPGLAGLGLGHSEEGIYDPYLERLRLWVGPDDTRDYKDIPKQAWNTKDWIPAG